jgi:tRNA A-37 threonylcarbamoyl transferase component Bud32
VSDAFLAPAEDQRIGQIVQDRYRIVRKLGEGGMGAVYEGEHTVIKRKVAIKCLHSQYASDKEMVARFHREAMATNAIRHPNIVEVTDMGRFADGAVYMVLEFLEGKEFGDILKKGGAMPLSRVVHIGMQVCDALSAAHDGGIVHRDLKPDNIYLIHRGDDPDFVKVLDFGIAKFREAGAQGITRTGHTMGTPHYMAPEQAQAHKNLDHRADIYSLGVILFHAITGSLPYDDDSFPMLMIKLIQYPAPRLRQLVPNVPPALDDLVDRMLAKDPNARPATCREVRQALAAFKEVSQVFSAPATPAGTVQGFHHTPAPGPAVMPMGPAHATGPLPGTPISDPNIAPVTGYGAQTYTTSTGQQVVVVKSGPSLALMGGIAAIVLVGLGAFGLAFSGALGGEDPAPRASQEREEPRDDPRVAPSEPQRTDPEPARPTTVVQQQEPTPTATVRVQITVTPPETNLLLDGQPIANPFDADLPQTSVPRRLEARLDGYQTVVRDLSLNFAQRVNFAMTRGTGVDDQRRPQQAQTQGAQRTPRSPGTTTQQAQVPVPQPLQPQTQTQNTQQQNTPPQPQTNRPPPGFVDVPL